MNHDPSQRETPGRVVAETSFRSRLATCVFERYQRPLISYVSRLLDGDFEAARDCVQDVFLQLCREPRDRIEVYVEAWLFKCCRH